MALKLFLLFMLLADKCGGSVPPCKSNWFGSPCRYECHCANNKCDDNGECTECSACEKGWFGPSCQYVDLVTTNTTSTTPAWVYDYPDILCNTDQETVTVSLDGTFYFTWLRLRVNAKVSSQDFKLQLKSANRTPVRCSNMYTSSVNDKILDIHCPPGAFFQEIFITGAGVKSLCSVYISGGRNVALGQNTTQTSDFEGMVSWHAVDGDSDSKSVHKSCTHTDFTDTTPTWTLTFQWPQHVNRYALYNRKEIQERLWGFILEAVQEDGNVAFTYTDSTSTNHIVYNIQSNTPQIPISGVTIVATHKYLNLYVLTLCEVKMFGDTACPTGRYGRDCENRCNCATSAESCFVSTGGCPSGCAAGYQGEACQHPCSTQYFGVNCLQKCSTNCTDELCQRSNGTCLSCIQGKQGPLCDKALAAQEPEECISAAVIVGLVIAFVVQDTLIVIGVLIWRRLRHNMHPTGKTTPHRYQSYPDEESVRTLKLNATTTKSDKAVTGQPISPDYAYEIPMNSTAQKQKARQLKFEDHVAYAKDDMANPYDIMDDKMSNVYEDTNDV